MNSKSLEVWQVQRLFDRVQHDLNFLNRLEGRMQQKHFPHNDPLLLAVKRTREAVTNLSLQLHHLMKQE